MQKSNFYREYRQSQLRSQWHQQSKLPISTTYHSKVLSYQAHLPSQHNSFRYALLLVAVLGYLCTPDRSDFNLPLGIFSFILWGDQQFSHKHRILYLLLVSLIGDIVWILCVGFIKWNQDQHQIESTKGMHQVTRIISIVNVVYKIGLVIYANIAIQSCRNLFNPKKMENQFAAVQEHQIV